MIYRGSGRKVVQKTPKTASQPEGFVDLHCHSTLSDGSLSVNELIDLAVKRGLKALAITDHDNMDSYELGIDYAQEKGLELIPGIEISAVDNGRDIHILGYLFDTTNLALNMELEEQSRRRTKRIKAILKKLSRLGIEISFDRVKSFAKHGVMGRPHIAMALQTEEYVSNFGEAFMKYLGEGGSAFVEKKGISVEQAIQLIHRAGGISVMAHPLRTNADDLLDNVVKWDIGGIETYTYAQKGRPGKKYREFARTHNLIATGGSDFHGEHGPINLGAMRVPYSALENLRRRLEIRRAETI